MKFGVGNRLALRRMGAGGEFDAVAGIEPRIVQPHPDVALLLLVLVRQPEHDLPPEAPVGRLEAVHPPTPGGIARESDHAAFAVALRDEQGILLIAAGVGQHVGAGLEVRRPEEVRALQRRQFFPGGLVGLRPGGQREDEMPQPPRRRLHLQGAFQVHVLANFVVPKLPFRAVHFQRQDICQCRIEVAARAVAVEAAEHDQALAAFD